MKPLVIACALLSLTLAGPLAAQDPEEMQVVPQLRLESSPPEAVESKPLRLETALDDRQHDPHGFTPPLKGPLVSELREDASEEIPGPETVVRLYEDAHGNQVREFVINGAVFQIQVTPANGVPYLLVDTDGNGLFDTRYVHNEPRLVVPQWVLYRW